MIVTVEVKQYLSTNLLHSITYCSTFLHGIFASYPFTSSIQSTTNCSTQLPIAQLHPKKKNLNHKKTCLKSLFVFLAPPPPVSVFFPKKTPRASPRRSGRRGPGDAPRGPAALRAPGGAAAPGERGEWTKRPGDVGKMMKNDEKCCFFFGGGRIFVCRFCNYKTYKAFLKLSCLEEVFFEVFGCFWGGR